MEFAASYECPMVVASIREGLGQRDLGVDESQVVHVSELARSAPKGDVGKPVLRFVEPRSCDQPFRCPKWGAEARKEELEPPPLNVVLGLSLGESDQAPDLKGEGACSSCPIQHERMGVEPTAA